MKRFFRSFGEGYPFFIYYISLFVITNFFGILCGSIFSVGIFLVLSTLFMYLWHFDGVLLFKTGKVSEFVSAVLSSGALIFSVITEIGVASGIFNTVSDADSGKVDLSFFAVIISAVAFLISIYGILTVKKITYFGAAIPFVVILPSVIILAKHGFTGIYNFISVDNILTEFLKGFIAFAVFISDFGILYSNINSAANCRPKTAKFWSEAALIYVLICSSALNLIFGRRLYSRLSSPLLSSAGAMGGFEFDEILLIVFSFCMLFRLSCKIIFISKVIGIYFNNNFVKWLVVLALISISGVLGVNLVAKNSLFNFLIVQGILNVISFILMPCLFRLFSRKNKNLSDDVI